MTLRQLIYRNLYLATPGWQITKWLRKQKYCRKCGSQDALDLHHLGYPFFSLWYRLLFVSIVWWIFDPSGMWVFIILILTPDLISSMKTLCRRCHRLEHEKNA